MPISLAAAHLCAPLSLEPKLDRESLLAAARSVRRAIARTASARDRDAALPTEPVAMIRSAGLGAVRVPRRYGGAELRFRDLVEIVVEIAAGDASVGQIVQPHFIFLERVRLMGSEAQRRRYLGAAAQGAFFGNAMSELGARPGEWATVLTPQRDGYRLDGRKFYATGTQLAGATFVGAKGPGGQRMLAVVPTDRTGVELGEDWDGFGQRATGSGSVVLENVAVAADEVIELAPWETRRHHTGAGSQIIHCAVDAGIAAAALDEAVLAATGRATATDDPAVQSVVGDVAALAFAAEAAVFRAAEALDLAADALEQGETPEDDVEALLVAASIAVAKAKIVTSQAALRCGERLFEVGGATGTARERNLDRHWRNARAHTLHDPIAAKFRVIGDHLLTGTAPPNTFTY